MHFPNHLVRFRKKFALTQLHIARFLGVDASTVSRIEGGAAPTAIFALGCALLFGEPMTEFFPTLIAEVRAIAIPELAAFSMEVEDDLGTSAPQRRKFLAEFVAREHEGLHTLGL